MRNEILRDLLTEYERRRADDAAEEQRRRNEIAEKVPQAAALADQRRRLVMGSVAGIVHGTASFGDLPARMEELNTLLGRELVRSGYPADYLAPVYRCPICRDTGYTGEPVREMCSCLRDELNRRMTARMNPAGGSGETFASFDLNIFPETFLPDLGMTQRAYMAQVRKVCERYARQAPDCELPDLVISGQGGLGKTFLLNCIARALSDRGVQAVSLSAFRLLEIMRTHYLGEDDGEQWNLLVDCPVLLIDDLGSEPLMQNITVAQLFDLINQRQQGEKSTVFTTNLDEESFRRRYTERIASRTIRNAMRCRHIRLAGDDLRTLGGRAQ